MAAHDGKDVLIKVGDGASPTETFTTIGGLQATRLVVDNALLDASGPMSGAWRSMRDAVGTQSVALSGDGVFTDSAAEETLRGYAFANAVRNYELHFGNGDVVQAAFRIARYERRGGVGEEARYALRLESAGAVTVIVA